jgi:hypothetical protein
MAGLSETDQTGHLISTTGQGPQARYGRITSKGDQGNEEKRRQYQ